MAEESLSVDTTNNANFGLSEILVQRRLDQDQGPIHALLSPTQSIRASPSIIVQRIIPLPAHQRHLSYTHHNEFPFLRVISICVIVPVFVYYSVKILYGGRICEIIRGDRSAEETLRQARIAQANAARAALELAAVVEQEEHRQQHSHLNSSGRNSNNTNVPETEEERQERQRIREKKRAIRKANLLKTLEPCTKVITLEDCACNNGKDNGYEGGAGERMIYVPVPVHVPDSSASRPTSLPELALASSSLPKVKQDSVDTAATEIIDDTSSDEDEEEGRCNESNTRAVDCFCSICLDEYGPGDVINWSVNRNCRHIYHHECIMAWLLIKGKQDCPCCRLNFIKQEDPAEQEEELLEVVTTYPGIRMNVPPLAQEEATTAANSSAFEQVTVSAIRTHEHEPHNNGETTERHEDQRHISISVNGGPPATASVPAPLAAS
jgi:hypothetical protein